MSGDEVLIRAVVVEAPGAPFTVEDVELGEPLQDEVVVRLAGTGICQTDLHIAEQTYPGPFPVVPGHEGAGVVERIGREVQRVEVGDRVVMTYPSCGHCIFCISGEPAYCEKGFALSFGGARENGTSALTRRSGEPRAIHGHIFQQSSLGTHALATERNVVKVPSEASDLPLELLGPLGCSMQTGAATVLTALAVRPGESIAVIGTGSVGLAAIMAAKIAGAFPIIAVDVNPTRLALAIDLGATTAVDARIDDVVSAILAATVHGAHYVLELTARPDMLDRALRATRMTGSTVLLGGAPSGTGASIDMNTLLNGRHLRGIIQGDAASRTFIPRLIRLHQANRFPFNRLVSFYDLQDVERAVGDLRSGVAIKPIIRMNTI